MYSKVIENGYITIIGEDIGGIEITEDEYNEIMSVIQSAPHEDGKGYRLKTDMTWEEYEEEPMPIEEEEPSAEEILDILTGEQT